jgi:cytochrome c2
MKHLLATIASVTILSLACNNAGTGPTQATPTGGGAMPTATSAPVAGGGGGGGGAPSADTGRSLVSAKGCIACHTIAPISTSTVGPCLNDVGDVAKHPKIAAGALDNNEANLKRWLANPPAVKPGTVMPNLGLSPAEIDSLVLFLQAQKGSC